MLYLVCYFVLKLAEVNVYMPKFPAATVPYCYILAIFNIFVYFVAYLSLSVSLLLK